MSAAASPLTVPHEAVPCPFCGSRMAYANLDNGVWFGVCAECFSAAGPGADTPEDAMAQWNHRAEGADATAPDAAKDAPDAGQPGDAPAATPKSAPRSRRASGSSGGAPAKKARPPRQRARKAPNGKAKAPAKADEPEKEGGAE